MIALLFAISAAPVAFAEDEADAAVSDAAAPAGDTSPEDLPPLIDPAVSGDNS